MSRKYGIEQGSDPISSEAPDTCLSTALPRRSRLDARAMSETLALQERCQVRSLECGEVLEDARCVRQMPRWRRPLRARTPPVRDSRVRHEPRNPCGVGDHHV